MTTMAADRNGTAHTGGPTMMASADLGEQAQRLAVQVSGWRNTLRGLLDSARAEMEGARLDFAALGKEIHDMREEMETMAAVTAREMAAMAHDLRAVRAECDRAPLGQVFVPATPHIDGIDGQGDVYVPSPESRAIPNPFAEAARRVARRTSLGLHASGRWPDGDDVTQEEEAAIQRMEMRGEQPIGTLEDIREAIWAEIHRKITSDPKGRIEAALRDAGAAGENAALNEDASHRRDGRPMQRPRPKQPPRSKGGKRK